MLPHPTGETAVTAAANPGVFGPEDRPARLKVPAGTEAGDSPFSIRYPIMAANDTYPGNDAAARAFAQLLRPVHYLSV